MKITKVTYQKAFITGPFLQEKIGFEAEVIEEIQSVPDALAQLKGMAEDFHKEANSHLYQEGGQTAISFGGIASENLRFTGPQPAPVIDYKLTEELEISIDNAQTIDELKSIKEQNPIMPAKLIDHYNKRLKELTNGK